MSGSVAAVIIAKQNQYMNRFQKAGAISPETATDLARIGCRESRIFRNLVAKGILRSTSQGAYYLDLGAAHEFRKLRLARAVFALLIVILVAAAVVLLLMRR